MTLGQKPKLMGPDGRKSLHRYDIPCSQVFQGASPLTIQWSQYRKRYGQRWRARSPPRNSLYRLDTVIPYCMLQWSEQQIHRDQRNPQVITTQSPNNSQIWSLLVPKISLPSPTFSGAQKKSWFANLFNFKPESVSIDIEGREVDIVNNLQQTLQVSFALTAAAFFMSNTNAGFGRLCTRI